MRKVEKGDEFVHCEVPICMDHHTLTAKSQSPAENSSNHHQFSLHPNHLKPLLSLFVCHFASRFHFSFSFSNTYTANNFPSWPRPSTENDDCRSHHITLSFCIFLIASHLCICARAKCGPISVLYSLAYAGFKKQKTEEMRRKKSVASHTWQTFPFSILFYYIYIFLHPFVRSVWFDYFFLRMVAITISLPH